MDDLVKTARRAKGSDLLPKVSFGTMNAETLILRMADRIEELEAKLTKAVALLSHAIDMTGELQCYHDHHGYCQAHNLEPRGECWVELSQALIEELKGQDDE